MRAGITGEGSACISVQADKGEPLTACPVGDLAPSATDQPSASGDDDD